MKTLFAQFWKRRSCRILGIVMILCVLPLLHPFIRQSIFGPTIDGIPWCVWEEEARVDAHGGPFPRLWLYEMLEKLSLARRAPAAVNLDSFAALPLYLHLSKQSDPEVRRYAVGRLGGLLRRHESAVLPHYLPFGDDGDVEVRRYVLACLGDLVPKYESEILPVMRRHLDDNDPLSRLSAAYAIWHVKQDRDMIPIVVPFKDHAEIKVRRSASYIMGEMGSADIDLFDPLAKFAQDADFHIRGPAVRSMRHFGRRAVPVIRKAMGDPVRSIRLDAIFAASELRKDGADLCPELLAFQNDGYRHIRRNATIALYKIDPKRFPAYVDADK